MAAVSRQREYLADASAVQFTRNPDGIGGALKKIGGLAEGSRIDNPQAAEAGHMFFANAFAGEGLAGLLATHPPLVERIRRLDPQFDGQFREVRPVGVDREELEGPRPGRVPPFAGMPRLPGLPQVPVPVLGFADKAASGVGHVDPEAISYAQKLHDGMPDVLRVAAHEPFSAHALVYALLLDPRADLRDLQLTRLKAGAEPQDFAETLRLVAPCPGPAGHAPAAPPGPGHASPAADVAPPAPGFPRPGRDAHDRRPAAEPVRVHAPLCAASPSRRPVPAAASDASSAQLAAKTGAPGGDGVGAIGLGRPAGIRPGRPGFRYGHARLHRRRPHPPLAAPRGMLPRRVRRGPANAQSIRPRHQAPDRRRLRGLHPGEPAGHRPRSGAAPRHLRHARLPATAARRGGSGRTMNDIAAWRPMTDAAGRLNLSCCGRSTATRARPNTTQRAPVFRVSAAILLALAKSTGIGRSGRRPSRFPSQITIKKGHAAGIVPDRISPIVRTVARICTKWRRHDQKPGDPACDQRFLEDAHHFQHSNPATNATPAKHTIAVPGSSRHD